MMNEKTSELISALIDEQGNSQQREDALERILADDDACKVWQCYHLIGCVLRGEVEQTGADLSPRIRARLEDEPTVLAPAGAAASTRRYARLLTQVTQLTPWKSAGLLALAASIVLAVVLTLNPVAEEGAGGPSSVSFAQEVDEMLTQHGEFTSAPGLNGLVGYAKLVSNVAITR